MYKADNMIDFLKECEWMNPNMEFAQSRIKSGRWDGNFTEMQREVLQSDEFWNPDKNIVIHGPTSSGKTLLAEIAALRQIVDSSIYEKKVLFLVPLRVLVTSQCKQFESDFKGIQIGEHPLKIFESSADYQDHDEQILNGDYDIAVVVYEKFFSMLNNKNRMLDECGLIVVDELQMLSSQDRGPKMEFSIMRVLENQQAKERQGQSIRIIGMTTSESGVDKLCRWLDAKKLGNDIRPVSLKQYFVSYGRANLGKVKSTYVVGSNRQLSSIDTECVEQMDEKNNEHETTECECFEIPQTKATGKKPVDDEKKRCLFAILRKKIPENSEELSEKTEGENQKDNRVEERKTGTKATEKILIFCNTKRNSCILAKEIAQRFERLHCPAPSDHSRREELEASLNHALQEFMDEEDINELSKLVSRGVVFHHSGLPSMVREAIEESFRDENGQIQIIVCTETLMIGVNLPADVVILYDKTVYRGNPDPIALAPQEYKNFIGRAGRLGYSCAGESYLLTDRLEADYRKYTSNEKTEIISPFKSGEPDEIAPFFMSWISGGNEINAELRISQGLMQGFCCNQCKDNRAYIAEYAKEILNSLKALKKKDNSGTIISILHMTQLSRLGTLLAPYALKLKTDALLIDYVIRYRESLQIDKLQFMASSDLEPVPSGSLLELLYTICQCKEVEQNPALQIPTDNRMSRVLNESVKNYLLKISTSQPDRLAQEGESRSLAQLAHMQCVMETSELRATTRAIVLALWMAGCSIRSIREYTKFNISISTSEIERLSESVAYLMEALSRCQEFMGMEAKDSDGMSILSTSMKYGVPRSLVSLASTHARGISRPFLLKIGENASRAGKTPMEFVLANTDERYCVLRGVLNERNQVPSFVQQVENKSLEIPDRFRKLIPRLQELDTSLYKNCALSNQSLWQFFDELEKNSEQNDWHILVSGYGRKNGIQVQFLHDGETKHLHFQVLRPVLDSDNKWTHCIEQFGQEIQSIREKGGISVHAITVLCGTPPTGEGELPSNQLVISSEMLGILLLSCLLKNSDKTNHLIYRILSDLKGAFILGGNGFFNAYGQIWELVKGYTHEVIKSNNQNPQLFYYPGIFDYKHSIPQEERKQYTELPWGNLESNSLSPNLASFYHRAMRFSRQAEKNLMSSRFIFCKKNDLQDVERFSNAIICENDSDKGMDVVLSELAKKLRSEPSQYRYDVGISFRGIYKPQMEKLKNELEKHGKRVLFMSTDDFEAKIVGDELGSRLTEMFSDCRHIIACDTVEYDESLYTFAEFNVIIDKAAYAMKYHQRFPIYRVQMEGIPVSRRISAYFRHCHYSIYKEGKEDELANKLLLQMKDVEQNGGIF